ncbi:unnamed protein product [Zymoseptoria tritici ST99CH_1E4]|uniref:F-box domain-containing protein n=1 Tax=Zymoseptoria tritici ST99CH_1E4 TaxID=1276532 RepID=A0A2H1FWI7_ZYMTR|nr:unnamed protein product [Zymoseptoria tritici ST99CH_1E4]
MASHFSKLADELILAIIDHLDAPDVLRLRTTSKRLADVADGPLQIRRHRLYLHPISVYHAIQVCSDPTWSKEIAEIVILGNSQPTMETREVIHFPDFMLDYHPWSQFPPTSDGERVLDYSELVEAQSNTFEQNYASLVEAIASLPRLRTISYAGVVTEPGFCGVSTPSILAHAKQRDLWRNSFGNEDQPQLRWALRTVWWSDVEVLTGIMAALPSKFEQVDIQQPMPAVKRYSTTQLDRAGTVGCRQDAAFRTSKLGDRVTNLSITVPGQHGWKIFLQHLTSEMASLQNLTININSRIDEHSPPFSQTSVTNRHQILWEEEGSRTRRFNPDRLAWSAELHSLTIRCTSSFPYSMRAKDVIRCLRRFKQTLQKVDISNVILYSTEEPDQGPIGTRQATKDVVKCLRTIDDLRSAHLVVPRAGCAPECSARLTNHHLAQCFLWPVEAAFIGAEVFEQLARELDIPRGDVGWDFAANVCNSYWEWKRNIDVAVRSELADLLASIRHSQQLTDHEPNLRPDRLANYEPLICRRDASDGARGESTDSTSCDIVDYAFNDLFDNFFDHLVDHLVEHLFDSLFDDLSNSHFNYLLENLNRNFDDVPIDHDCRFDDRSCDGICNYNCDEYYNAALRVINHECDNVSCNNNMVDRGHDHAGFDGGDYKQDFNRLEQFVERDKNINDNWDDIGRNNTNSKRDDARGGHNAIRHFATKLHVYCMVERSKYGRRPSVGHAAVQRDKHYNSWRIRNAYCAVEFHPRSDFSTNHGACSAGYGGVVEQSSWAYAGDLIWVLELYFVI